jgi:hypothetical protein
MRDRASSAMIVGVYRQADLLRQFSVRTSSTSRIDAYWPVTARLMPPSVGREMLENGTHATIAEIANAEKINEFYVGRVLGLTLLAPDFVEAILGGRQPGR